uniref:Consortin, connexin sorting protein b n=1 Tax=Mastacembelus armatus TaxID=205130 RepID=A0A7N8YIV1_9TELE
PSNSTAKDGPSGPSPELLASLQSLGENSTDYTLLPHSLHQVGGISFFLQLEKLYHERLLSNLAALQENWAHLYRLRPFSLTELVTNHFYSLSNSLQSITNVFCSSAIPVNELETSYQGEEREHNTNSESGWSSPQTGDWEGDEEEDGEEEETYEEGREEEKEQPSEETPEEEVKVECSSPDGLVSILKRRRASLDGLPPPNNIDSKQNSKRKVRFSEPEDGTEQEAYCLIALFSPVDEVGGDSCLILLLLCLVTVVISIGGTALYCTLVDTYSSICTDFTHNVDFYVTNVRRFFVGLGHWLPFWT